MTQEGQARESSVAPPEKAPYVAKFDIVVIPVSDVDRAKGFYARLGWRLDADFASGNEFRVIQFTPPGSGCSVIFGKNVPAAAPGAAQGLYLIVTDIEAARADLLRRGVEVSELFHERQRRVRRLGRALLVWADPGQRARSRAWQLPLVRLIPRSGRQRLAVSGSHDAAPRSHRPHDDNLCVCERSGQRASACRSRSRAARGADGASRPQLAGLVCRVTLARAGRHRAAAMND